MVEDSHFMTIQEAFLGGGWGAEGFRFYFVATFE